MSPAPSCVETKMFLNPKDVLNLPFVVAVVKYLRLLLNIFALSSPDIFSLEDLLIRSWGNYARSEQNTLLLSSGCVKIFNKLNSL